MVLETFKSGFETKNWQLHTCGKPRLNWGWWILSMVLTTAYRALVINLWGGGDSQELIITDGVCKARCAGFDT